MKLNSSTFLRFSALILIAVGAYGIYSWQMKEEKVVEVSLLQFTPWYYYGVPLALLIIFGWALLRHHPFKTPGKRIFTMFVLFAGIAYLAVQTVDHLPTIPWPKPSYNVPQQPVFPMPVSSGRAPASPVVAPPRIEPQPAPTAQPTPTYSYQRCWDIAKRAYTDDSIGIPPECNQAWEEYKRRQNEIAEAKRRQDEEDRRALERADREREERQRRAAQDEQRAQREEERRARAEEERQRRAQREQDRRVQGWIDTGKRIFRRN